MRKEVQKTESSTEYFGALAILVAKDSGTAADEIIERVERLKKVFSESPDDQLMISEGEDDPPLLEAPPKRIEDHSEDI